MATPFHIISNAPLAPPPGVHPRPDWLRVKFFGGERYQDVKRIMRTLDLHTVCESARCPNMGECWEHGTATFSPTAARTSLRAPSKRFGAAFRVAKSKCSFLIFAVTGRR